MYDADLVCWNCGGSLAKQPLPLSRTAECSACLAELHVCRLCRHYDTRLIDRCREDRAEPPRERDRANFCDWFEPQTHAWRPADRRGQAAAHAELAALFGEAPPSPPEAPREPEDPRAVAEALFRKG